MKKITSILAIMVLCLWSCSSQTQKEQVMDDSDSISVAGDELEEVKVFVMKSVLTHEEDDDCTVYVSKVLPVGNDTYIAVCQSKELCDPDADTSKGLNENLQMRECCVALQYVKVVMKDGKLTADRENCFVEAEDLPGTLGESYKVWQSDDAKNAMKRLLGYDVMFGYEVDVDDDGIFEYYAAWKGEIPGVKTALLTLGTDDGKVGNVKNIAVALRYLDNRYVVQADLEKHQVFWKGTEEDNTASETCVDIVSSQPTERWYYSKDAKSSKAECTMNINWENERKVTEEEFANHCSHSNERFVFNMMPYLGVNQE